MPQPHHLLAALYWLLLRLHPAPFRATFGEEMRAVFAARLAEAAALGHGAIAALAARELAGLVASLAREHSQACAHSAARAPVLTAILATFYLAVGAFYLTLDIAGVLLLAPWLGLVYSLIGAAPGVAVLCRQRHSAVALTLALFLALALTAPALNLGPRKAFLRAATGIRPAMTIAAVDRRMAAFARRPDAAGTLGQVGRVVYSHAFGPGDSDAVVVQFAGDKVISRQVLPD
jgi:hypothetical protein